MIAAEHGQGSPSDGSMVLKPSPARAFLKGFGWFFAVVVGCGYVTARIGGLPVNVLGDGIAGAVGGILIGLATAVFFTPRVVAWDEERIQIRTLLFPAAQEYAWEELEAYGSFRRAFGTFLIKFDGGRNFQIASAGFRSDQWRTFQSYLTDRFPEKGTRMRIRLIPWRGRKR
ncbi:MAG: hypothetical protein ACREFX_09635 [Opitutaceae bacterium]